MNAQKKHTPDTEPVDDIVYDEDQGAALVHKLRERLKACEGEKKEYLDGWQRAQADMTNMRRQHTEELTSARGRAEASLVESLLPVLDSFDVALTGDAWERVDEVWRTGITHIHTQFLTILEEQGITTYGAPGDVFDPALHEALSHVSPEAHEGEGESNTIARVQRRGYKNARGVIRPAQVVVYS